MTYQPDHRRLEDDIERTRADLAATLNALQNKVSLESLTQGAFGFLRANSATVTKTVDQTVRSNPLAAAVIGAGVAWLLFGGKKAAAPTPSKLEAMSSWEDDGGPARPSDQIAPTWTRPDDARGLTGGLTGRLIEDHPMLTGAAMMAAGVALGAILPRTKS